MKRFFKFIYQRLAGFFTSKKAWGINPKLYNMVLKSIPEGGVLLELGSGPTTKRLAERLKIISIEHDKKFVGKYSSSYIHAPIQDNWYCTDVLARELPERYDGILVDGPPKIYGRKGFARHLDLFNVKGFIFIDDVERPQERSLVDMVADKIGRGYKIYNDGKKAFAVFHPEPA